MTGLTPLQQRALDFLRLRAAESETSPSYGEIAAELELCSKSHAHRVVSALEQRGYVRRRHRRRNGIELIDPAAAITTDALVAELRRRGELPDASIHAAQEMPDRPSTV